MMNVKQYVTVFENQNKGLTVHKAYDMERWLLLVVSNGNSGEPSFDTPLYTMDKKTQQVSTFTPTEYFDMYERALSREVYSK